MRRGQALVEAAVVAPLLLLLLALPLAAHRWTTARLAVLDAARAGVWERTVRADADRSHGVAPGVQLRVSVSDGGGVRAIASTPAPQAELRRLVGPHRLPKEIAAVLGMHVLPLDAGTERSARTAIAARWLGGRVAAPVRALLRLVLREDPVRVEFSARPPGRR